MARAIRIEFGGAFYHVMGRGNSDGSILVSGLYDHDALPISPHHDAFLDAFFFV